MKDKFAFWKKSYIRPIGAVVAVACSVGALQYMVSGGQLSPATAALLADPLSVLSGRSPGSRSSGALLQSKKAYAHDRTSGTGTGPAAPSERVLSNVRTRPPVAVPATETGLIPVLPTGDAIIPDEAVTSFPAGVPAPGGGFGGGGFPGTISGGGGGGTPGTGGAVGVGGNGGGVPSVPSAVPEPSTWALMLTGYFLVGIGYRRRRKSASTVPLAADTVR
ncbi:PEPxxWA-CTERM sorting domain-containing protein [Sphingomonas sp. PAMC 26621]|uniref:PEPxxWA-CTERM sorting domain-containing protein n=1 Tax=Sphingomonas sp. PAMC 26621 TaxID=1112213 RepID=UPI00028909A2|nr:PEPxxWA-CTERM sorting domain-containing protein [Sphingomonas sp. PAMC 26621]